MQQGFLALPLAQQPVLVEDQHVQVAAGGGLGPKVGSAQHDSSVPQLLHVEVTQLIGAGLLSQDFGLSPGGPPVLTPSPPRMKVTAVSSPRWYGTGGMSAILTGSSLSAKPRL